MTRVNINSASKGFSSHRYNPITLCSLDFSDLSVTKVIECIKGDNFTKVKGNGFLRLAPTIFPAYGRVQINSAAFFVPESQLIQQSDAFHSNMSTYKGRSVVLPHFIAYEINHCFAASTQIASDSNPFDIRNFQKLTYRVGSNYEGFYETDYGGQYDFIYPIELILGDSNRVYTAGYYRLTHLGRQYFKIFKSLGYDFCSLESKEYTSLDAALAFVNYFVNALPLLAYAKIYCDMFLNPHMYNTSPLVALLKSIHDCEDSPASFGPGYYTASSGLLSQSCLTFILNNILVPYQHNMYLDAWNGTNSPDGVSPSMINSDSALNGLLSPVLPEQSSTYQEKVNVSATTTYESNVNSTGSVTNFRYLSQYGLNWIDSFFKYVRRNGLFGSKAIERMLVRFGLKSSDYNSHTVNKIFEGSSPIDFSAVLSQTDSYNSSTNEGKTLGSYAGYGAAGLNFEFSHKCDSFGYIIVLSWLSMVPIKPTGFKPSVLRYYPLDFYTPEWDGKTLRAIPMCELGSAKDVVVSVNADKSVFGFTDLYDDYREDTDSVFGDFVLDENVKDFAFSRDLGLFRQSTDAVKPQNNDVQYYYPVENDENSNPFQFSREVADRFYLQLSFDITAKRPILSKSSALDLTGEGDIDIKLGGSQMS